MSLSNGDGVRESRRRAHLRSSGLFARKHGGWVLLACALVAVPCLLLASRLELETDFVKLFPSDAPYMADFQYFSNNFGISDILVLYLRGDAEKTAAKSDALLSWLRTCGRFTQVERQPVPGKGNGTVFLAFPWRPTTDQDFGAAMVAQVQRHLDETDTPAELTGPPLFTIEGRTSVQKDIRRTGLLAVVLILGILILSFGDPVFPLVALLPLGTGIVWCLAFAQMAYGRVSLITAALPTTLIGIGIDYALHLRAARLARQEDHALTAWGHVYARVGPPLLIGMLTTAAAFFALLFADMRMLSQMGYVGGVGLIMVFLVSVFTIPALTDWRDRFGLRFRPLPTTWVARVGSMAARHRVPTIALFLLATVPMAWCATRIQISSDPRAYEDPKMRSRMLHAELAKKMGVALDPLLIATPDLNAERRVLHKICHLIESDDSPPGEKPRPFRRVDCLSQYLDRLGFRPTVRTFLSAYVGRLSQDLHVRPFVGRDRRFCMVLYPRFTETEVEKLAEMREAARTIRRLCGDDIARLGGAAIVYEQTFRVIHGDMVRTGVIAGVIVIAMLVLLLRQPRRFVPALIPLAGGVIWMLGITQLVGRKLTATTVIAMPLVIGLGIDYGVHIVYHLRRTSVRETLSTTGRAILIASATTAAAFFSLGLAASRALAGMGLAAATGICSCLVWSLVFLPALLGGNGAAEPEPQKERTNAPCPNAKTEPSRKAT